MKRDKVTLTYSEASALYSAALALLGTLQGEEPVVVGARKVLESAAEKLRVGFNFPTEAEMDQLEEELVPEWLQQVVKRFEPREPA